MRRKWMVAANTVLIAVTAVCGLLAQTTTATILGIVTDSSGAVIPGVTVQITNVGTKATQSVTSDEQGRYRVPDLPVGSYEAQAALSGFQTTIRKGITLTVGSQNVVDFNLPVGQTQETITVQSEVTQVDTTSSQVANLVDQVQMRELPLNGRNFGQLILLAPGVQTFQGFNPSAFFGRTNSYSVAGARPEGQSEILDDADIQTYFSHGTGSQVLGTSLGVEAIAEFQTLTNTYSAQFGGNGAVVNSVTKSGTNNFHGSAYDFLRNSALDARRFIDPSTPPPFRKNQFGGSVGGPIKKDKMFFFANYEGIRQLLGESALIQVPDANAHQGLLPCAVAAAFPCNNGLASVGVASNVAPVLNLYPMPNGPAIGNGLAFLTTGGNQIGHEDYVVGRYDWTLSDRDSLFVRYISDKGTLIEPFGGSSIPLWPEEDISHNQFTTIEHRRLMTPNIVNLARFSFSRPVQNSSTTNSVSPLQFFPGSGRQDGSIAILGGTTTIGANSLLPFAITQNKFNWGDDVYWTRGAHNIKIGVSVQRMQTNINPPFQIGGVWTFNSLALFLQGIAQQVTGPLPNRDDAYRAFRETDLWPYFQDDWKVSKKLTLNLGLRYEFGTNPTDARNLLQAIVNPPAIGLSGLNAFQHVDHVFISNPSTKNIDPRVGFAYDPFSDHKTSIRAGFGIFHNLITPRAYASNYYIEPPFVPATQVGATFPFPFTGPVAISPQVTVGFDYNIHTTPYIMEYNLNIQREVYRNTVLTLGYVGSRSVHQFIQVDRNPYQFSIDATGTYHFVQPNSPQAAGLPVPSNPRLNPTLFAVNEAEPIGNGVYNSFQSSLVRRFSGNWQGQLSYTHSVCLDYSSGSYGLEGGSALENPLNAKFDRGPCSYDVRDNLTINSLYAFPFKKNRAVSGWQVSGIWSAHSGSPFSITDGVNITYNSSNIRPNLKPGCATDTSIKTVAHWFDASCYFLQTPGTIGNVGRNTVFGPGWNNVDVSLAKNTKITEQFSLQFRAEMFNAANHSNYRNPSGAVFSSFTTTPDGSVTGIPNPAFGRITALNGTPRQIQFAMKLLF